MRKNADLTDLPVHAAYKIAKRLYAKERHADGIFIPCPRWPTITDVPLLEDEIGKPSVTSSIACSWYAMKLIGIKEKIAGFGSLMPAWEHSGTPLPSIGAKIHSSSLSSGAGATKYLRTHIAASDNFQRLRLRILVRSNWFGQKGGKDELVQSGPSDGAS